MTFSYKNTSVQYNSIGTGRTIVLLHGFLENSSMWDVISESLLKKYRVVCIDLLGHGATENHGYIHTMQEQAEMVVGVLKHLRLRKYIVVGHSMGGYIALEISKIVPKNIKGLCLMNSTALPDSEEKKINRDRAIVAVKQNHKTFVRIAIPMLFSEGNRAVFTSEIKSITNEALEMSPQGIIAALEGMKIRKNRLNLFKNSKIPKLVILGKKDTILNYKLQRSYYENSDVTIVEFPDGHMSHIENYKEFTYNIVHFIENI